MGNTRLSFTDKNANGVVDVTTTSTNEILQENHYYPFGLNMSGPWMDDAAASDNKYQYNGKELNTDFGLSWYDYGARWYDASVGRWWSVDPMADSMPPYSTYNYVFNCPIKFIDPDGETPVGPGDKFKSINAAAKDWAATYNHESIKDNKERSSAIYSGKDSNGNTFYSYTPAETGAEADAPDVEATPKGTKRVADIHSHAAYDPIYDNENFSPGDKSDNKNDNELGYVVTPGGTIQMYDPKSDKVTVIASNAPSDSNSPSEPPPPKIQTPPNINVSEQ